MRNTFNNDLLLIAIGCLQPASSSEAIDFLKVAFPQVSHWPDELMVSQRFDELIKLQYLIEVRKGVYSLTLLANNRMDVKHKRLRDKIRLSLLRSVYDATLRAPEAGGRDLVGDSPTVNSSSTIQDGSRPIMSGLESSPLEGTHLQARHYWPRVAKQLLQVGLDSPASGTSNYRYCSFPTLALLQKADNSEGPERDMTLIQLALAIGITPRLLSSFIHKPENHYRNFSIPKKTGGYREISSPRFFLKTVQYWIKSYFLTDLKIHPACHAYREGYSIQTNALNHVGKRFVANVDIENFFGSITDIAVKETLHSNGIGQNLSLTISKIATLDKCLPQGSPISPVISNAFLFSFDCRMHDLCSDLFISYTRYADDITISSNNRNKLLDIVNIMKAELYKLDLKLNAEKTRISSDKASQRVTGLVVNKKAQPPREYQRKVRAMFHNAYTKPQDYVARLDELSGHYSYLKSFDSLKESSHLKRYKIVLTKLKASLAHG